MGLFFQHMSRARFQEQGWGMLGTQRATRQLSGVVTDTEQIRETLRRGLEINSKPVLPPINPQRQNGLTHDRAP